jgi:hypothetical protein
MWYVTKQGGIKRVMLLMFAGVIVSFYFLIDPATASFGIPCLFHKITGWDCWGCGGQRAFHELLHGNVSKAFHLNALVFPVTLLGCYTVLAEITQLQPTYNLLRQRSIQLSAAILVAGFTIFRNII